MKNSKAIVSIAAGKRFVRMADRFCRENWKLYADKHGYDLIILNTPPDPNDKRVAAWQKCLVCSQDWSKNYERIVWVDTDIIINPNSPDICEGVPLEKVGAVNEFTFPTREEYQIALGRMYKHWENLGFNPVVNFSAPEYYKNFGIECDFQDVVQTGVMVFNPKIHREMLEHVYYNYEEKGLNYEMRPLSYEILRNNFEFWIDKKFNMHIQFLKALYYPYLLNLDVKKPSCFFQKEALKLNIETMFANSHFLHFTGATEEMKLLNWKKFVKQE